MALTYIPQQQNNYGQNNAWYLSRMVNTNFPSPKSLILRYGSSEYSRYEEKFNACKMSCTNKHALLTFDSNKITMDRTNLHGI